MTRTDLRVGVLVVFGVLIFVGYTLFFVLLDQAHRDADAERAAEARSDASNIEQECGGLAPLAFLDCYFERGAANEEQRQKQADLYAQQDMASWTGGLFWVGLGGIVTSATGIWLLYETLNANRSIGQAQVRAYLGLVSATVWIDAAKRKPNVEFVIKNSGQSPALDTIVVLQIAISADEQTIVRAEGEIRAQTKHMVVEPECFPWGDISAGEEDRGSHEPLSQGHLDATWGERAEAIWIISLFATIFYRDVFGNERFLYCHGTKTYGAADSRMDKAAFRLMPLSGRGAFQRALVDKHRNVRDTRGNAWGWSEKHLSPFA